MMRVPVWMILGLLTAIIIMDITTVWMVRSKIITAVDIALDAAMVGGLIEYDAKEGTGIINEELGEQLAGSYFRENLKLDNRLENRFLKNTNLEIEFAQDRSKPSAVIRVKTVIQAMSPKVLGLDGVPVTIKKNQYYVSTYK